MWQDFKVPLCEVDHPDHHVELAGGIVLCKWDDFQTSLSLFYCMGRDELGDESELKEFIVYWSGLCPSLRQHSDYDLSVIKSFTGMKLREYTDKFVRPSNDGDVYAKKHLNLHYPKELTWLELARRGDNIYAPDMQSNDCHDYTDVRAFFDAKDKGYIWVNSTGRVQFRMISKDYRGLYQMHHKDSLKDTYSVLVRQSFLVDDDKPLLEFGGKYLLGRDDVVHLVACLNRWLETGSLIHTKNG